MAVDGRGRELFIVDNSASGWTGLWYLEEWSGIRTLQASSSGIPLPTES